MKIALIGASGNAGSRILAEALRRGHTVTAIARRPERIAAGQGVAAVPGDVNAPEALAPSLRGHDAVVSSVRFAGSDPRKIIAAVKQAKVPRLLVVGGAGSLEVAPGQVLLDTPQFHTAWKPEATAGRDFLRVLREEKDLAWTFLSPSALFAPGERTGKFRIGGNQLLADANGKSWISMEDYAVALLDELENPRHTRERFTVGY